MSGSRVSRPGVFGHSGPESSSAERVYAMSDRPGRCPSCGSPRRIDVDPSESDAEPFAWCESCSVGTFASEEPYDCGQTEDQHDAAVGYLDVTGWQYHDDDALTCPRGWTETDHEDAGLFLAVC